jgi:hypothetical protein
MAHAPFPKRREGGDFTVYAWFTTTSNSVVVLVRDYVEAWLSARRTWVRIWRSDRIVVERLSFSDDFSADPRVEAKPDEHRFAVVLEGRATSARWKDWAASMVEDIARVFPEAGFERFDS